MNKWAIALLLVLLLAGVYLTLPTEIAVTRRITIKLNTSSAYRSLAEESKWAKWWPGEKVNTQTNAPLSYERYTYSLEQNFFQTLVIQIKDKDREISSTLLFIPLGIDNTVFEWKAIVQGNFFQKVHTYLRAKSLQRDMEDILKSVQEYLEKEENVYGFKVRLARLQDTVLVSTRFTTSAYPTTNEIYQYISLLKEYVASQHATVTNYPMLHVKQLDSSRFESLVALPTSVGLKGSSNIVQKRMVQGNILEAEVRGGSATAQDAMIQLDHYVQDRQLASPAIPFMSLVTDRSVEKDTARWVTRIYYPVY